MVRTSRWTLLLGGALIAAVATACTAEVDSDIDDIRDAPDATRVPPIPDAQSTEELVDVAVGELVEVEDGIFLPVPEPGESFAIEVLHDDGGTSTTTLTHDRDGHVRIVFPDDHLVALPEGTSAACASKCSDSSFSFVFGADSPAKWKSKLEWFYRHNQSPISYSAAVGAFKSAAAAVPSSRNSCGMDDKVSATQVFRGETNVLPGVGVADGEIFCKFNELSDEINVIGWGFLPGNTLAVACVRSVFDGGPRDRLLDVDMRFDKAYSWITGNGVPANCTDAYSLRAVATHEFGHAYGLGHTNQCNQVMAPLVSPCTNANRKFGKGDVLGLRSLY
ncbi:MAG: matrixin family metalloprotease [Deltaproteobacteria bacterium]|nr:matrixin family metalloprotease [Deltaproteobacteria bacterium]